MAFPICNVAGGCNQCYRRSMSKPKRITDTAQLEAMIDRLRKRQNTRIANADELDAQATELFKQYGETVAFIDLNLPASDTKKEKASNRKIEKAIELRKRAARLRSIKGTSTEKRIQHLSRKLAEPMTGVLPGLITDESVNV